MKILFLSGLYSHSLKQEFIEQCKINSLQNACDTFQWAVIEGLNANRSDFSVLSYPWLPCYPLNYKSSKVKSGDILYDGRCIGKSMGYSSLILYKQFSIENSVIKSVSRWIENSVLEGEKFAILTYTLEPFFIKPLSKLKKKHPNMIIASIVTDLVDDIYNFKDNLSFFKRLQSWIRIKETKEGYAFIDKFILLTKQMEEKIPQAIGKNIVVEGIYKNSDDIALGSRVEKSILYTGVLEEYAGVKLLVDAFTETSCSEYRLIICGNGPLSEYISEKAHHDSRIDYRGSVSREEAVALQKSVSLLINPRQPNGGITKYSFPSKTMEYMSSGTPMIGYKLEGMPFEYYDYMFIPGDLSLNSLVKKINACLQLSEDELHLFGSKARAFILNKKTAEIQVKQILDFIEKE